jgi:tetratricopeptide (TPR) repeat protein
MNTSKGMELVATRIKRPHVSRNIKYQLQDRSRDKHYSIGREAGILLGSSLILCLITIIGLGLLPSVFGLAKAEKDIVVAGNDTTLYNKGLALYRLDNYTGAIEYFSKALAIDPHNVRALTDKGLALYRLGNHTGAIEYYDKALAIDPDDTYALTDTGLDLDALGNYTGAIKYYDKALAIDPQHVNALVNKGADLGTLGNHTGAIEYYDKALAIDPKDVAALDGKGLALNYLGNYTGAIEYFDKTLAIDPKHIAALDDKGLTLNALGNYIGAIEFYNKALAMQPNDTYALNSKGAALSNLGNYTGAIEFYNKTLAIDPKNTFALTNKAAILDRLGNHTTTGNATNSLEYENSTYGIKMQYPSDWQSVGGASNSSSIVASFNPQRNYTSYVTIQIENLSTGYTPDQYLNSLMLGDAADYKDFPDIRFNQNTTNNIVLAGHPGYLLNDALRGLLTLEQ